MALVDPAEYPNREEDWRRRFDEERRKEISSLLTDELVAEHQANPLGYRNFHSPELQKVLNYFRTRPILGKYAIYASRPWEEYRIAVITERGEMAKVLDEPVFGSEEEAMHGVFMRRVADFQAGHADGQGSHDGDA